MIISDIESTDRGIMGNIPTVLPDLGNSLSYVTSGIVDYFQDFLTSEAAGLTLA